MFQPFSFLPLADLDTTMSGSAPAAAPAERPVATTGTAGAASAAAGTGVAAANTTTSAPGTATSPDTRPAARQGFDFSSLIWIVLMVVVLYFFLFRGQRKQEQKRKLMLNEMKKGDRVMTIGGLIARVVSIEGDEVVLKVDESANVKATYSKKAIQEVLNQPDEKK